VTGVKLVLVVLSKFVYLVTVGVGGVSRVSRGDTLSVF
jgi:hypothetical protein